MNEQQRAALDSYVRQVADQLGLRDWTFSILEDPCSDDSCALCTPTYGRRLATLEFCAEFRNHDAATQRHTVVHELLHCVFAPEQDHVRLGLVKHLSQSTYDAFYEAYQLMHEYAIDGLADSVAPLMPPIQWGGF